MHEVEIFAFIFFIGGFIAIYLCSPKGPTGFELYPHSPSFMSPPDQDYYYANPKNYYKDFLNIKGITQAERDLYNNDPEGFYRIFRFYPDYYNKEQAHQN